MLSMNVVTGALELGFIYALVAMALFLSFRVLNIADMTTDGSFTLGCAVSAVLAVAGHPILGIPLAITNTGIYTVKLAVMGFSANVNMLKTDTIFSMFRNLLGGAAAYKLILAAAIAAVVCVLLILFLRTRLGLSIRATGDNPDMVRASSINTRVTVTIGLCAANAVTALSGAILAQYQKTADINLGTGMVIIGLASLIIGETIFGRGGIPLKVVGAVAGSVIYRFIIAVALRLNLPAECLKLISAVLVALAIALPYLRQPHKSRPRADRTDRSV